MIVPEALRNLYIIYMLNSMYYLHLWPTIAFPCSYEQTCEYVVWKKKVQEPNLPLFFADPELMKNAQAS